MADRMLHNDIHVAEIEHKKPIGPLNLKEPLSRSEHLTHRILATAGVAPIVTGQVQFALRPEVIAGVRY